MITVPFSLVHVFKEIDNNELSTRSITLRLYEFIDENQ